MFVIPLDMHSRSFTHTAFDLNGRMVKPLASARTSEENLRKEVAKVKGSKIVVVEECELSQWVKDVLEDLVDKVVIRDPKRNRWIAEDEYNDDKTSTVKLARLYLGGFIKEVRHPDAAGAALRALFVHYVDMSQQQTRIKNKLKSCFRRIGIDVSGPAIYADGAEGIWLTKLNNYSHLKLRARHYYEALRVFQRGRQETLAQLKKCKRPKEIYQLLLTIPGVGPVVALGYLALIGSPWRFSKRTALFRYATLGNCYRESDQRVYKKKPMRCGNRALKWVVFRQFKGVMQRKGECRFKRMYERLRRRGLDHKKARRQVCRRLLATVRAVWKKGEAYRLGRA